MSGDPAATLEPGIGFHLRPDGSWKAEKIPPDVLDEAVFSGYLTINGYRSTVFETPDQDQWAQKSVGTVASRIAARWLRARQDIVTQVADKMDRDGADKDYDEAISDFAEKMRKVIPPIDKAIEKAADLLASTKDKITHSHPRVQDKYVKEFVEELEEKRRDLENLRRQISLGLNNSLDKYESEAHPVIDREPNSGEGSVSHAGSAFYSPQLSTDFLELPQSEREKRELFRFWYTK